MMVVNIRNVVINVVSIVIVCDSIEFVVTLHVIIQHLRIIRSVGEI